MQDNPITNQHLDHLESLFVRYGAVPTELNSRNRALLGERQIYERNGRYYRQDRMEKAVRYALGVEPYPEQYPDY